MVFKNSLKIATSKFNLVFKLIAFEVIVILLVMGIGACVLLPNYNDTITEISNMQIGEAFAEFIGNISGGAATMEEALSSFIEVLEGAIKVFFEDFLDGAFWIVVTLYLVMKFILSLRDVPVSGVIYSFMTEHSEYSFFSNLISNFSRSVKYALWHTLFSLPFDAILVLFVYYAAGFLISVLSLVAPFLIMLIVVTILALKNTLFFGWLPYVVAGREAPLKGFPKALRYSLNHFWTIFAAMTVYCLLVIMISANTFTVTFGVAFIIFAPFAVVVLRSYELVKYATVNEMRYYAEPGVVVTPYVSEIELINKDVTETENDIGVDSQDAGE